MSLSVDIRHRLGGFTLDARFEAPPGITALFGRSGAGKTSVIRAVAGLLHPEGGRIAVDGEVLTDTEASVHVAVHRRRIGYVFQDARLFPHLSVGQNLAFGRLFGGRIARDEVERLVHLLDLRPLLGRGTADLSGGERSRVALARALMTRPRLLLLDEPLAALDAPRKAEILRYLLRLGEETSVPMLYVTHSVAEVAQIARTLVVLKEGAVQRSGPTAEVLADPAAVPALGVREAGAVLQATLHAHHPADGLSAITVGDVPLLMPEVEEPPGTLVRLRINAADVTLARERPATLSALNVVPVTILSIRPGEGPGAAVALSLGPERILARVPRRALDALDLAPGLECFAVINATAISRADVSVGALA
ncbi:MAG: molybdenum ABC transporter ATP-binding protein [Pseudomonadota bacterium]